jgi:2-polyprenyl-3-methyl-5-hydroxy-6-metoxy-1,4-benzoquinol methylase
MTTFKESHSDFYDLEYFLSLEFRYFSGAHQNKPETLHAFLQDVRGKRILDLGCGGGLFSYLLSERGASTVGIDYSQSAVDFATSRYPQLEFKVGSAYDLSAFAKDSFDVVVMMDIIEHLSDQSQAMNEVMRVLRPGGHVVMSTDVTDTIWHSRYVERFIWFSMRFSKQGRAYRLIKETEAKILAKKFYNASHIGLMSFEQGEDMALRAGFKIERHEVYPLVKVWWRDAFLRFLPMRWRGEHQMLLLRKP